MRGIFFFLFVVLIASCKQIGDRTNNEKVLLEIKEPSSRSEIPDSQNFNLDSIKIRVVTFVSPVLEATYVLENNCVHITSIGMNGDSSKEVCEKEVVNQIKRYLSIFYIDKEENIEFKRTKKNYIKSTDYPYIKVVGYREGKEVFTTDTQIGEEDYDVEYNPQFLEFYEFLDSLVKKE